MSSVSAVDTQEMTADELTDVVCTISISEQDNIPDSCDYSETGTTNLDTAFGLATTGILLFSAASLEGEDPFYPTSGDSEMVDWCLCHP